MFTGGKKSQYQEDITLQHQRFDVETPQRINIPRQQLRPSAVSGAVQFLTTLKTTGNNTIALGGKMDRSSKRVAQRSNHSSSRYTIAQASYNENN